MSRSSWPPCHVRVKSVPLLPITSEPPSEPTPAGERITSVVANSPAAKAGLEVGDTILSVDGYPVGYVDGRWYPLSSEIRRATGTVTLEVNKKSGKVIKLNEVRVGESSTPDT